MAKAKSSRAAKKVNCGICSNWEIKRPERCSNTLTYKGVKRYFCTRRCKEKFEKAPEKFL
jgi:YHS domain-containing protein